MRGDEFPMNSMNRQEIIAEGLDPVPERYAVGVPNSD